CETDIDERDRGESDGIDGRRIEPPEPQRRRGLDRTHHGSPSDGCAVRRLLALGRGQSSGTHAGRSGIAVAHRFVQRQWLRDALEREGTDLDETKPTRRDMTQDVLPDEALRWPGLRRVTRRDVERPAEVVTLLVDAA